jgi:GxxExxY protein
LDRDPLTERIIGCAIEVHRALGPGLLEGAYEQCLAHELTLNRLDFRLQVPVPVHYKGLHLDCAYRIDLVIANAVVLELKSVDRLLPLHDAQLLTYMRLVDIHTGLLVNFNVTRLVDGVRRFKI